jgi:hypothetical protein
MSSYMTTMFGTVHVSANSKISVPLNAFVYVIMCLNYSVITTRLYDGVNNLEPCVTLQVAIRELFHTDVWVWALDS